MSARCPCSPSRWVAALAALAFSAGATGCQFDTHAAPYANGNIPPDGANDDAPPPDAPTDGSTIQPPADCPQDYVSVPGAPMDSKYKVRDSKKSWAEARQICSSEAEPEAAARTHLVALETSDEYNAIAHLYGSESQQLGLTLINLEFEWQWVTGVAADMEQVPWDLHEPKGVASCAAIQMIDGPQGTGNVMRVVSVACTSDVERKFICECQDGIGDDFFE